MRMLNPVIRKKKISSMGVIYTCFFALNFIQLESIFSFFPFSEAIYIFLMETIVSEKPLFLNRLIEMPAQSPLDLTQIG